MKLPFHSFIHSIVFTFIFSFRDSGNQFYDINDDKCFCWPYLITSKPFATSLIRQTLTDFFQGHEGHLFSLDAVNLYYTIKYR